MAPYWAYPPYPAAPVAAPAYPSYASYGIPMGYAYAPTAPTAYFAAAPPVAAPALPALAPAIPRGEYRVGSCLMICQ